MLMLRGHWGLRPSREMTMTSVAVAPGSLGAPPAMLTPKMYHLQQGLSPTSGSPISGKVSRPRNPFGPGESERSPRCPICGAARCDARESVSDARRSYGGVLRNGTQPRLESWNLIRGWSLDTAIVASRGGFLRRAFFWYRISPRSLIATCREPEVWMALPLRLRTNEGGHWFFFFFSSRSDFA